MRKIFIFLPIILLYLLSGCGKSDIEKIEISCASSTILSGESMELKVTVTPSDAGLDNLKLICDSNCVSVLNNEVQLNNFTPFSPSMLTVRGEFDGEAKISIAGNNIKSNELTITVKSENTLKLELMLEEKEVINSTLLKTIDPKFQSGKFRCEVATPFLGDKLEVSLDVYSEDFLDTSICVDFTNKIVKTLYQDNKFNYLGDTWIDLYCSELSKKYMINVDSTSLECVYNSRGVIINPLEQIQVESELPSQASSSENSEETESVIDHCVTTVWVSGKGEKYHSNASCSGMKDPYQISKDDAIAQGKTACSKCY